MDSKTEMALYAVALILIHNNRYEIFANPDDAAPIAAERDRVAHALVDRLMRENRSK